MSDVIQEPTIVTVVQPQSTVTVLGNSNVQVESPSNTTVTILPGAVQVVSVAQQGPPGPPGTGSLLLATCGTNISIGICVVLIDGQIFPGDPTNPSHAPLFIGVSTESGLTNQTIHVAQLGSITLSGLSETRYFIGLNGTLSTSPVAMDATWMRYIGTAESATQLILVSSVSVLLD